MEKLAAVSPSAAGASSSLQLCTLDEAAAAVAGGSGVKFDESIDVAVQLGVDPKKSDQMVRGAMVLPAGTGRSKRVAVVGNEADCQAALAAGADKAGLDDIIAEIKDGKTDFDVLIATPMVMRQLAAVGKILGPKGLMPNPKDGTVAKDIADAVGRAKSGQVSYRCDKAGIVHTSVGRASFAAADIKRNIESLLAALKRAKPSSSKGVYLRRMAVSATMGASVLVDISSYR
ncbi:MAG: 50S ribosomal protein L1 [Gammaproteobacteria bacterium]